MPAPNLLRALLLVFIVQTALCAETLQQWLQVYHHPTSSIVRPFDAKQDPDGNVIFVASATTQAGSEMWLVKVSGQAGSPVWTQRFSGPPGSRGCTPERIAVDPIGNIIVAGTAYFAGSSRFFITKHTGSNGTQVWLKTYNANGSITAARAPKIATDSIGDVFISGINDAPLGRETHTFKCTGTSGSTIWEQKEGGANGSEEVYAIAVDNAGNPIISTLRADNLGADLVTIKYQGFTGNRLWSHRMDGPTSGNNYPSSVTTDHNDNVVVTGSADGSFYTGKYSGTTGATIWERFYNSSHINGDYAQAGVVDRSNNIIVAGIEQDGGITTIKYTGDGAVAWKRHRFREGGLADSVVALSLDAADNPIVSASIFQGGFAQNIYTVEYAGKDGSTRWEKLLDQTSDSEVPVASVTDLRGDLITVGIIYDTPASRVFAIKYREVNTSPTVTLLGDNPQRREADNLYSDLGATGYDEQDGQIEAILTSSTVIPNRPGTYQVTWSATDRDGATGTAIRTVQILDSTRPVLEEPVSGFAPSRIRQGGPIPDFTPQVLASDISGTVQLTQTPPAGSIAANLGPAQIEITARDSSGNTSALVFSIDVMLAHPTHHVIASTGEYVPSAGVDPRIGSKSTWTGFGVPAINSLGNVAFLGRWKSPANDQQPAQWKSGIVKDGNIVAATGEAVASIPGVVWKGFKDPALSETGGLAFRATIAGPAVSTLDDDVIAVWSDGSIRIFAREGDSAPGTGGGTFHSFENVAFLPDDAPQQSICFTGKLRVGSGLPAISIQTDRGAWRSRGEIISLLFREGDRNQPSLAANEAIRSFRFLDNIAGSSGHGRSMSLLGPTFHWTTTHGRTLAGYGASPTILATRGQALQGSAYPGALFRSVGVPSHSHSMDLAAVSATLGIGIGGVTSATSKTIVITTDAGSTWEPIVRSGADAAGFPLGVRYRSFADPVVAADGSGVGFLGKVDGPGIHALIDEGIWWKSGSGEVQLVACEGAQPPDTQPGTRWKRFNSIALPSGNTGPLLVASLESRSMVNGSTLPIGPGGVTTSDDMGVWGVDSEGDLRLLLREGQSLRGTQVRSFQVLRVPIGAAGSSRSFNGNSEIIASVATVDGASHIVRIVVP